MASTSSASPPPPRDIFCVPRAELERSPSVLDHTFASWTDELAWREEQCAFIHKLGIALKISQMVPRVSASDSRSRPPLCTNTGFFCFLRVLIRSPHSSTQLIYHWYASLPLPPRTQTTTGTACVYLHRFFSRHSFAKHRDIHVVCAACLFLACKVEESRRKVSFLIEQVRLTIDPAAAALHPEAPEFVRMRDAIFDCERDVLDTIEYRLHVRSCESLFVLFLVVFSGALAAMVFSLSARIRDRAACL